MDTTTNGSGVVVRHTHEKTEVEQYGGKEAHYNRHEYTNALSDNLIVGFSFGHICGCAVVLISKP